MFRQVTIAKEELLRESGALFLHACEPYPAQMDVWTPLPHRVVYRSNWTQPNSYSGLFTLNLTITSSSLIVDALDASSGALMLEESAMHMFLGWTIQKFKTWTLDYKKCRLIIQSKLPHITEWFVEYNYSVKRGDSFGPGKGFIGSIQNVTEESIK